MKKLTDAIVLVGSSTESADMEYASGLRVADPVVFVKWNRKRWLVVPELEYGRARRAAAGVKVMTPRDLKLGKRGRTHIGAWAVALLKMIGVSRISVPASFPHGVAGVIKAAGIGISVKQRQIFPQRAVKSALEIRNIKEAQQAAVIAIRTAVAMIGASTVDSAGELRARGHILTSGAVRRAITGILLDHDCFCRDIIVACGLQAADPHETGRGPLRASEAIVIDIFPQHLEHGYWGDITRTVVKGRPSPRLRKMYKAVKAAQSAALARIKPGVKCATVHRAAVAEFVKRGFSMKNADGIGSGFIHGTGHGVGLAIHEAPSIAFTNERLKKGNVITVEPGLYYPDTGGIRIEDTILVTASGWRYLVPCEKKFELQ